MEQLLSTLNIKLDGSIAEFTERKRRMFKVVNRFKYSLIILSALLTVVLGLQIGDGFIVVQKNTALIIGAVITAITTLMTFWNVEEYWLKSKIIELQLLSLKSEVEFEQHAGFTEERIRELFNKYQIITGQQQTSFRSSGEKAES